MSYQVIILGLNENETKNNFSFFVSSVEDVVKPWFLQQTKSFNIFRCSYEGSLILVGTYFRLIVYKHWFKKYQQKELSHIDIFLFLLVSIQNLNMLMYMISTVLKITNEASDMQALGYAAGSCFCNVHIFIIRFDALYKYIGCLGIAIYRIFFITRPYLVDDRLRKNRLFHLILHGGLIKGCHSTINHWYH